MKKNGKKECNVKTTKGQRQKEERFKNGNKEKRWN